MVIDSATVHTCSISGTNKRYLKQVENVIKLCRVSFHDKIRPRKLRRLKRSCNQSGSRFLILKQRNPPDAVTKYHQCLLALSPIILLYLYVKIDDVERKVN